MAELTAAQLQQMLDGLTAMAARPTGNTRIEPYDQPDPTTWAAWRSNFELTAQLFGWDNKRSRIEAARAMTGVANSQVRHIALNVNPAPANGVAAVKELLDEYEKVFVPAGASDKAKQMFHTCRQKEDETLHSFHARLRDLYVRAYPAVADPNAEQVLRDQFFYGLKNAYVQEQLALRTINDYTESLANATSIEAAQLRIEGAKTMAGHPGPSINAMAPQPQAANPANVAAALPADLAINVMQCYRCKGQGHRERDCPTGRSYRPYNNGNGGNYKGNSNSRGGRSTRGGRPGRGGRGGNNRGRPSNAAIAKYVHAIRRVHDDEMASGN